MKKKKKPLTLKFTPLTTTLLMFGFVFVLLTGVFIGMSVDLLSEKDGQNEVSRKTKSTMPEGDTERKKDAGDKRESFPEERQKLSESKTKEEPTEKSAKKSRKTKGRVAFVIDDVGYNTHELEPFLEIPVKLTFAVLPKLDYTEKAIHAIKEASKNYILHQPMEPLGEENPGPGALYTDMNSKEIEKVLLDNLSALPGVQGINNHMGSKATANEQFMNNLFSLMKGKEMFFLDSVTTPYSVAEKIAENFGIPYLRRAVFLDNKDDQEYIRHAIKKGVTIAKSKGDVVMIGHVWSDYLAEEIKMSIKEINKEGYDFVFLEEILNRE